MIKLDFEDLVWGDIFDELVLEVYESAHIKLKRAIVLQDIRLKNMLVDLISNTQVADFANILPEHSIMIT